MHDGAMPWFFRLVDLVKSDKLEHFKNHSGEKSIAGQSRELQKRLYPLSCTAWKKQREKMLP
jgi:hypothetical protein